MKKIYVIFVFMFCIMLSACIKQKGPLVSTDFELNGGDFYEGEKELFLPVPFKNNQIFTGWSIDDKYDFNPNIGAVEYYPDSLQASFSISKFKSFSQASQVFIKPNWHEIREELFFTYTYLPNSDSYEVSLNQDIQNYPRELSIPELHLGKPVTGVADYGFKGFKQLLIVNLPSGITSIGKEAFIGTSLYEINVPKNIMDNAFENTLYSQAISLTVNTGFTKKKVDVGKQNYYLNCDLDGGKFIEEEFEIFIPIPHKNNSTFIGWTVDDKNISSINNLDFGASGTLLDLNDYLNLYRGKTFVAKWQDVKADFLEYMYLDESDSYAVKAGNSISYPRELTIPDKYNSKQVTAIWENGFSHLTHLSTVHLPEAINKIGKGAFSAYSNDKDLKLYEINIPDSLKIIDDYAFANTYITYMKLPEGIESIGDLAFYYTFLKDINIPNSLLNLNPSSFRMCRDLEFNISVTNSKFTTIPESGKYMVYTKDEKTLLVASHRPEILVPKGVETIGPNVFAFGIYNSIVLSENVKYIEDYAFQSAHIRNQMKLSNHLEVIDDYAFYNLTYDGRSFPFPQSLKRIGKYAFVDSNIYYYDFPGDNNLEDGIEDGLKEIDDYAFYKLDHPWTDVNVEPNRVNQLTIIIPNSVTSIGEYALNWADVIYFDGFVQIDKNFMNNNFSKDKHLSGLRTIYLPLDYFDIMKESIIKYSPNVNIEFLETKSN